MTFWPRYLCDDCFDKEGFSPEKEYDILRGVFCDRCRKQRNCRICCYDHNHLPPWYPAMNQMRRDLESKAERTPEEAERLEQLQVMCFESLSDVYGTPAALLIGFAEHVERYGLQ